MIQQLERVKFALTNLLDKIVIELMVWRIKRSWPTEHPCSVRDYDEFPDVPHELNAKGRCSACQASEVKQWLEMWKSL